MIESLVAIVIGIAIGVGLVMLYVAYRIKMITNALDEYISEALEEVKDSFMQVLIEKDHDTYYCYRKEDRQFVCQGQTAQEIKDAFKLKYPNKVAIVSKDTNEDILAEFKQALAEKE